MSRRDRARKGGPDERRQSDRPYIAAVTAATVFIAAAGLLGLLFTSGDLNVVSIVLVVAAVLGLLFLVGITLLDRRR